jgi:hypothetical protein
MNSTGYTSLTKEQIHFLYGPKSPYNSTQKLQQFLKIDSQKDLNKHIEKDVKALAEVESFKVRQKDIVLSPIS